MRKIIISLLFFYCISAAFSQPLPDSVQTKYRAAKTDAQKGKILYGYFVKASYADSTATAHAMDLFTWFKKQNDAAGADYTELHLASVFLFKGDYSTALNMAFPILYRFEKRNDSYGIMLSNHIIGLSFSFAKNHEQAFQYLKKSVSLAEIVDDKSYLSVACNDIGVAYSMASMPDSGLFYTQKAVKIDMENKDLSRLPVSLSTLAENYIAANDYEIAIAFLRKSVGYSLAGNEHHDNFSMAYIKNDFAQAFLALKQYDSACYYARQAIEISRLLGYKDQMLRSYEYLYKSFEETKRQDSVNKYFRLAMTAKDSLFSIEKTRSIEALHFREQMRQQEIEAEKQKAEGQRKQNIQYALIALGIITFIVLFFLLSHSIIVTEKWISFFGVLGLLVVFEFINLLIHPSLAAVTHESPVLMLLALVLVASLLIPLHNRMEKWIKEKMTEKNKKIRLESAKKTIEQLGEQLTDVNKNGTNV